MGASIYSHHDSSMEFWGSITIVSGGLCVLHKYFPGFICTMKANKMLQRQEFHQEEEAMNFYLVA